jgi:carbonic anhydrase
MKYLVKQIANFKILVIILALMLLTCSKKNDTGIEEKSEGHIVHWGYDADNGPARWGENNSDWILCAEGLSQSPVDLSNTKQINLPDVIIDILNEKEVELVNQAGVINALDNGHTIQINAKTGEKMTFSDKIYALIQFHFHAPSEHTVDGNHYPMEMHFVHQADDGSLAVVGVFMEEGAHNPGIEPLWKQLNIGVGKKTVIQIPDNFDAYIFSGGTSAVYHYDGSLTTPPCSEGVKWFIRKRPAQLSKEQIAEFTAVYDQNNRPVQSLNERTVYLDKDPVLIIR